MKCDVAVIIPTICRDSLLRAVRSVFAQDFPGTIHLLIGIDVDSTGRKTELLRVIETEKPARVFLTVIDLGYSTSKRHGGVHTCAYSGSLRSIMSFAANSELVAYLDDDDWWLPNHLRLCVEAMQGKKWAFSLCWYANSNTSQPICLDEEESVGPGRGWYNEMYDGFVRPSALILNKLELIYLLHLWSHSPTPTGDSEDRLLYSKLRKVPEYGETRTATVCYSLDPKDENHLYRCQHYQAKGINLDLGPKLGSVR